MNEWNDLFSSTAGSAATLTGLIFVSISLNLNKILSISKLSNRAIMSLLFLLVILLLSILFLVPNQPLSHLGFEVFITGFITWIVVIKLDQVIYRETLPLFRKKYIYYIVVNQIALLCYLTCGIMLIFSNANGIYWAVPGFFFSFIKSMTDAWVLLVEINR